jgi:hypothetical protein
MDTNKYADEVNEMKHTMVLDFLITFGNSVVNWGEVVTKMLDPYNSLDIDDIFYECCEQGYISELIDPFTKIHTYQITKEGLKFLQRRNK